MNRIAFLSLLATALVTTSACNRHETVVASTREVKPVRAFRVRAIAAAESTRYAATVEPMTQVTLAFRAPGVVEQIHRVKGMDGRLRPLEIGDFVPAGAVLATIRATEYRARTEAAQAQWSDAKASRTAAQAQVAEAQAALTHAEQDWGRAQKLLAGQAMTRAEADAAKARYEAALSRVEAARAQVSAIDAKVEAANAATVETRVGLGDTALTAPFAAYVISRHVERGAFAQPGMPAFVLADLSRVKIVFFVPDKALAQFQPGSRVTATVESLSGKEVAAIVQSVSPAADPVTRNFRVEAIAANPGRKLSAGLVASVFEPASEAKLNSALAIPLSAVVRRQAEDGFAVFLIEGDTVRRRPVQLGEARGNEVTIVAGLTPNQQIVREGLATLRDGDAVKVTE